MIVAARDVAVRLGSTLNETVPSPVPADVVRCTQDASVDVVQLHESTVETSNPPAPPADVASPLPGQMPKVHGGGVAGACVRASGNAVSLDDLKQRRRPDPQHVVLRHWRDRVWRNGKRNRHRNSGQRSGGHSECAVAGVMVTWCEGAAGGSCTAKLSNVEVESEQPPHISPCRVAVCAYESEACRRNTPSHQTSMFAHRDLCVRRTHVGAASLGLNPCTTTLATTVPVAARTRSRVFVKKNMNWRPRPRPRTVPVTCHGTCSGTLSADSARRTADDRPGTRRRRRR